MKSSRPLTNHSDPTKEQLDDYREQLYQNAETNLEESKIKHSENIQALSDEFKKQLSLLSRCEQQLNSPILNDSINATAVDEVDARGVSDEQRVLPGQRMSDFGAVLKAKEATLHRLFDEWNDVQVAIIALAVRTLGQGAVDIEDDQLHPTLTRAMSKAASKHAEAESHAAERRAKVDHGEARVKRLATNTVNSVDEAFKVSGRRTRR